ncbi:exo-beta-N-acetylmuramidase NamZ domain-containing protein [Aeromonas cavernicola]|uniref:DUF1343 domain-containing protein n=1 Tax=Aeromonas cavernicola TaxID=1006623 RepID=A0A2H9U0J9_9GAMM|nr:DUF1343 domain-containing protein [Aeromonas cavernicola]PJG57572.1 DUF1343 domain-containing protein [Aeromonas cavernicola]
MKRLFILPLLLGVLTGCQESDNTASTADRPALKLGIDQPERYGPLLRNKRVGLIVNQSSRDSQGRHTIEKLLSEQAQYGFTVTTLFSVEHGLRGNEEAGAGDNDGVDPQTGLPVVTLYGRDAAGKSNAHPSAEELANIDILIYDLQDVGVRFFTYTISMHKAMESIQANGKAFMVLDRPNPNGDSIYGPLLQRENVSGIGMHPIPMAHGLTSAEFAAMIAGQGWLNGVENGDDGWDKFGQSQYQLPAADLHLIAMQGYRHDRPYSLPVRPSPNLRTDMAVRLYPSLALFEATSVNMGRGSDYPHEQVGFPDPALRVNTDYQVDSSLTAFGWPQGGERVYGESFRQALTGIAPQAQTPSIRPLVRWWFKMQQAGYQDAVEYSQERNYLDYAKSHFIIRPLWLAKLVGNRQLLTQLQQASADGLTPDETVTLIETSWQAERNQYLNMRQAYLLYR